MSENDEKTLGAGSAPDQTTDSNKNVAESDINTNEKSAEAENAGCFAARKIDQLEQEVVKLKDALLRKIAEMDNLRKRLEKEKVDAVRYANKNFAKDLLTVLDNFERAMENSEPLKNKIEADACLANFISGIHICEKELLSIFKRYGISQIAASEGDNFNHDFHQAMCEVPSTTHKNGTIMKVFQTGYMYNNRLLRPSMVSVAKKS